MHEIQIATSSGNQKERDGSLSSGSGLERGGDHRDTFASWVQGRGDTGCKATPVVFGPAFSRAILFAH